MKELSTDDIQKLHGRLMEIRAQLVEDIRTAQAEIQEVEDAIYAEGGGGTDVSELQRLKDIRTKEMEIDQRQLLSVEEAERRMNEGSYGLCIECGRHIAPDRLFALPAAARCAACESRSLRDRH